MKKLKQWIKRNSEALFLVFNFLAGLFIGGLIVGESSSSKNAQLRKKANKDNFEIIQRLGEEKQALEASMSGCLSTIVELENKPPEIVYKTIYETVEKTVDVKPTNFEYETWCRNNTVGLVQGKNNSGKLVCGNAPIIFGCNPMNGDDPFSLRY